MPTPTNDHKPVPSRLATKEMLRNWGFPVQGHHTSHDEMFKGDDIWKARNNAVRAGFCSDDNHNGETPWVGTIAVNIEQRAEGMQLLAWFVSNDRFFTTGHKEAA